MRLLLERDANNTDGLHLLGLVDYQARRFEEAEELIARAITSGGDDPAFHSNHGAVLNSLGRPADAEAACRRAVALAPNYAEAHNNQGLALELQERLDEAAKTYRRAVELEPRYAEAGINLAAALFTLDRALEAEAAYRRVLDDDPDLASAHNGLGVVLLAIGRLDEAVASFRRAVELAPRYAEALYNLAASHSIEIDESDIAALETMATDGALPVDDRTALHFALVEILDWNGAAERAFHHAVAGNRLRRTRLRDRGLDFDGATHDRLVDDIVRVFDADFFAARQGFGDDSEVPVFIVGMPRSGTTLVEQIAASHPAVFGAGERDDIGTIAGPQFPDGATELDVAATGTLARAHMERIGDSVGATLRITDKTPVNFLYLGLIAILFPRARIIHCRREARDVCLSCYFQNFTTGQTWSTDLENLGRYHRAYWRIMEHWR